MGISSRRIALLGWLAASGCSGFAPIADTEESAPDLPLADARVDAPLRRDGPRADGGAPGEGGTAPCPGGLAAPSIQSFTVTDGLTQVPLDTPVSLLVKASAASGPPLVYGFSVAPPADPVQPQGGGAAQWRLSTAKPGFFTTRFTITATVRHACAGGPSSTPATVQVKVLGNLLASDRKNAAIEAVGSNGKPLGQVAGAALFTSPGALLLLDAGELAVADEGPKLVKVLDLPSGAVVRSFGSDATGLLPQVLDRTPAGDLLVGFAKNKLFRYSVKGQLLQTITLPHSYTGAGLTHQSDGTILTGVSGAGTIHALAADGSAKGVFAQLADTGDTNALLAIAGDEILVGGRNSMNDGKLVRLAKSGAVISTLVPATQRTFYNLRPFAEGYLFLAFYDRAIYRLDQNLQLDAKAFASLPIGSWASGLAWLDLP